MNTSNSWLWILLVTAAIAACVSQGQVAEDALGVYSPPPPPAGCCADGRTPCGKSCCNTTAQCVTLGFGVKLCYECARHWPFNNVVDMRGKCCYKLQCCENGLSCCNDDGCACQNGVCMKNGKQCSSRAVPANNPCPKQMTCNPTPPCSYPKCIPGYTTSQSTSPPTVSTVTITVPAPTNSAPPPPPGCCSDGRPPCGKTCCAQSDGCIALPFGKQCYSCNKRYPYVPYADSRGRCCAEPQCCDNGLACCTDDGCACQNGRCMKNGKQCSGRNVPASNKCPSQMPCSPTPLCNNPNCLGSK